MQSFKDVLEFRLEPIWAAIVAAVAALYGLLPGISLFNDLVVKSKDGFGWLPFLIFGPISFVIVTGIMSWLLGSLFGTLVNKVTRISICFALVFIFWTNHGVPHPFGLVVITFFAVSGYSQTKKVYENTSDREEFFNE